MKVLHLMSEVVEGIWGGPLVRLCNLSKPKFPWSFQWSSLIYTNTTPCPDLERGAQDSGVTQRKINFYKYSIQCNVLIITYIKINNFVFYSLFWFKNSTSSQYTTLMIYHRVSLKYFLYLTHTLQVWTNCSNYFALHNIMDQFPWQYIQSCRVVFCSVSSFISVYASNCQYYW